MWIEQTVQITKAIVMMKTGQYKCTIIVPQHVASAKVTKHFKI